MSDEVTLRDTFAAAALTGLLAGRKFTALDDAIVAEPYAEAAYGIADAMLRERERTNHDAAPAARAGTPGTGDTQEPVAWAVMDGTKTLVGYHSCSREKAEAWAREYGFPEVVPLYRQPTLTDAEREAVRYMIAAGKFGQRDEALTEEHAATLRGLLERLGGGE
jgi:hypothetical protein